MEVWLFCENSCQKERRSALCSLDVNKVSRNFFNKTKIGIFCEKFSRQNERSYALCSLNVNKVSRIFSWFFWEVKVNQSWTLPMSMRQALGFCKAIKVTLKSCPSKALLMAKMAAWNAASSTGISSAKIPPKIEKNLVKMKGVLQCKAQM